MGDFEGKAEGDLVGAFVGNSVASAAPPVAKTSAATRHAIYTSHTRPMVVVLRIQLGRSYICVRSTCKHPMSRARGRNLAQSNVPTTISTIYLPRAADPHAFYTKWRLVRRYLFASNRALRRCPKSLAPLPVPKCYALTRRGAAALRWNAWVGGFCEPSARRSSAVQADVFFFRRFFHEMRACGVIQEKTLEAPGHDQMCLGTPKFTPHARRIRPIIMAEARRTPSRRRAVMVSHGYVTARPHDPVKPWA